MLVHNIFCCVYSEQVPEDGSLCESEDEDVMSNQSPNSSGTFAKPVVLEVGSGHSRGSWVFPARRGEICFHLFTP